jgi:phenylacetate-CoA ligase
LARYRFVVDRAEHRDQLCCEVVLADARDAGAVAETVRAPVRAGLRFDVGVDVVDDLPEDAR